LLPTAFFPLALSSPDDGAVLLFFAFFARRDSFAAGPALATTRLLPGVDGREVFGVCAGVSSGDVPAASDDACAAPPLIARPRYVSPGARGGPAPGGSASIPSSAIETGPALGDEAATAVAAAAAPDLSSSWSCCSKYSSNLVHSTMVVLGFLSCSP
jgi:hypothetical protein